MDVESSAYTPQSSMDNQFFTENQSLKAKAIAKFGPPLHQGPILIWFTILFGIIFTVGLFGNFLTIAVVRRTRDLQSNTNFFLCNLAISDLLLLLSGIPFDLIYMWRTYPAIAGSWFCILKGQLSETASNVSILTILILTIERWVAICRPLHLYVYFNRERIFKYISIIWIIGACSALFLSIQFAVIPYRPANSTRVFEDVTQCDVEPSRSIPYIFEVTSILFFVLPILLILGAYGSIIRELNQCQQSTRMRKGSLALDNGPQLKARFLIIVMLITVATVFSTTQIPLHVQRLMTTYDKKRISSSQANAHFSQIWFTVTGLLHFLSAAANPIIYNVMSRRFRLACRCMLVSFSQWCIGMGGCDRRQRHGDHEGIEGFQIQLAPVGRRRSTDTTSFKERFALWLLGGRKSRWQSCYHECQSMEKQMVPEEKMQQEWL